MLVRNEEKEEMARLHNQVYELLQVIDAFCQSCQVGNEVLFRRYRTEREAFINARKEFIKNQEEFMTRHLPEYGHTV